MVCFARINYFEVEVNLFECNLCRSKEKKVVRALSAQQNKYITPSLIYTDIMIYVLLLYIQQERFTSSICHVLNFAWDKLYIRIKHDQKWVMYCFALGKSLRDTGVDTVVDIDFIIHIK